MSEEVVSIREADVSSMRRKHLRKVDSNGMTFLHRLAEQDGTVGMAQAFVKRLRSLLPSKSAQDIIDAYDCVGRTALSVALRKENRELSLFFANEASPEAAAVLEPSGWSCLAFAIHFSMEEVALKLIERLPRDELFRVIFPEPLEGYRGSFVRGNALHRGDAVCGGTPMHFAVRSNAVGVVEALLEHYEKEHMEIGDGIDRPAEALAARRGHDDLVRLLWERAPLSNEYWAAQNGTGRSQLREFFHSYEGDLKEDFWERLITTADERMLRELLCCAVHAMDPDLISDAVSRLSQAAIDEPLSDGSTAAELCSLTKVGEAFLPLLLKSGPKSAVH